jgi:hypothetical protein
MQQIHVTHKGVNEKSNIERRNKKAYLIMNDTKITGRKTACYKNLLDRYYHGAQGSTYVSLLPVFSKIYKNKHFKV